MLYFKHKKPILFVENCSIIDEFSTIDKIPNDVLTQTVKDIEV